MLFERKQKKARDIIGKQAFGRLPIIFVDLWSSLMTPSVGW
jgi:hypothetical protein